MLVKTHEPSIPVILFSSDTVSAKLAVLNIYKSCKSQKTDSKVVESPTNARGYC